MTEVKRAPIRQACPHCRTMPPWFLKDWKIAAPKVYLCLECGITWVLNEGLWFEADVPNRETRAPESDNQ